MQCSSKGRSALTQTKHTVQQNAFPLYMVGGTQARSGRPFENTGNQFGEMLAHIKAAHKMHKLCKRKSSLACYRPAKHQILPNYQELLRRKLQAAPMPQGMERKVRDLASHILQPFTETRIYSKRCCHPCTANIFLKKREGCCRVKAGGSPRTVFYLHAVAALKCLWIFFLNSRPLIPVANEQAQALQDRLRTKSRQKTQAKCEFSYLLEQNVYHLRMSTGVGHYEALERT